MCVSVLVKCPTVALCVFTVTPAVELLLFSVSCLFLFICLFFGICSDCFCRQTCIEAVISCSVICWLSVIVYSLHIRSCSLINIHLLILSCAHWRLIRFNYKINLNWIKLLYLYYIKIPPSFKLHSSSQVLKTPPDDVTWRSWSLVIRLCSPWMFLSTILQDVPKHLSMFW